jgi:hypothetical protein
MCSFSPYHDWPTHRSLVAPWSQLTLGHGVRHREQLWSEHDFEVPQVQAVIDHVALSAQRAFKLGEMR